MNDVSRFLEGFLKDFSSGGVRKMYKGAIGDWGEDGDSLVMCKKSS